MSQINVTAAAGRLVPLPGGKVVKPGDVLAVEENDLLIYRLLDHGDLVKVPQAAPAPAAPPPPPPPPPQPAPQPQKQES